LRDDLVASIYRLAGEGQTIAQIAKALEIPLSTAGHYATAYRKTQASQVKSLHERRGPDSRFQAMCERARAGYTDDAIATDLAIPVAEVQAELAGWRIHDQDGAGFRGQPHGDER
jgi:hypothetical protein